MKSKIRTYQELDYFEKHIVDLLEKIHARDREDAVRILNEYRDVLNVLRDGQESANTFAEIFDDADKIGTSGDNWIDNMFSRRSL
jgi:hypothetical protein